MTAGMTPTPIIQRQTESKVCIHSSLQFCGVESVYAVESEGMPLRCLTMAIRDTRLAASWPRGWHANASVNILPRRCVGANLESI